MAMPSVASMLLAKPRSMATNAGDVVPFASGSEEADRERRNRLAGRAMGWDTGGNDSGPLRPLSDLSVYRSLRAMQKGQ